MARSAFNPFRTQAKEPQAESSSSSQVGQDDPFVDQKQQPSTSAPAASTSNSSSEPQASGSGSSSTFRHQRTPSPIEKPPEYTPSADVNHGERTMEFGPRRPFQPAPVVHPQHTGHHQQNGWGGSAPSPAPPLPPRRNQTPQTPLPTDDGRPTTTPVPGHPLLNDGRLLVYPRGYLCPKCSNMGYKHSDPSHPCRKCWQKYSRPFTGPLTYSSFRPNEGDGTLQKPLPRFRPPTRAPPLPNPNPLFSDRPPAMPSRPAPTITPVMYPPAGNPNALVLQAGDPRIGGRLCWNCGGGGRISLFFGLDDETCRVCRGIGRVF